MRLDKVGLSFRFRHDDILYIWPWRERDHRFASILLASGFNSLHDVCEFWRDYWRAAGAPDDIIDETYQLQWYEILLDKVLI